MNDNIRDWMRAGGLTAKTLTHGDWYREGRDHFVGYSVFSQYSYRNQPTFSRHTALTYQVWDKIAIPYTDPVVQTSVMAPAFKTPRQLRNRALVSDMWHKGIRVTDPGAGSMIHKDGYNLLSGDYSVRWYGDAEQRLIWWDVLEEPMLAYGQDGAGLWTTKMYGRPFYTYARWKIPEVWNILDKSLGMDLDANPRTYAQDWMYEWRSDRYYKFFGYY